jgi:hypothetical protein
MRSPETGSLVTWVFDSERVDFEQIWQMAQTPLVPDLYRKPVSLLADLDMEDGRGTVIDCNPDSMVL